MSQGKNLGPLSDHESKIIKDYYDEEIEKMGGPIKSEKPQPQVKKTTPTEGKKQAPQTSQKPKVPQSTNQFSLQPVGSIQCHGYVPSEKTSRTKVHVNYEKKNNEPMSLKEDKNQIYFNENMKKKIQREEENLFGEFNKFSEEFLKDKK